MTEVYKITSGLEKEEAGVFKGRQSQTHKKNGAFFTQQTVDLWSSLSEDFLDAQNLHKLKGELGKYLKMGVCFRRVVFV